MQESQIVVGDTVLVKQTKRNKFSTRYDPRPYVVTKIRGTMVTASRPGHYITRNVSFYKRIPSQSEKETWRDSDEQEGDVSDNVADEINEEEENEMHVQERRYPA